MPFINQGGNQVYVPSRSEDPAGFQDWMYTTGQQYLNQSAGGNLLTDPRISPLTGGNLASALAAAPMMTEARPGSTGVSTVAYLERRISRLEGDTATLKAKVV